jgi:hypothetical protein
MTLKRKYVIKSGYNPTIRLARDLAKGKPKEISGM